MFPKIGRWLIQNKFMSINDGNAMDTLVKLSNDIIEERRSKKSVV